MRPMYPPSNEPDYERMARETRQRPFSPWLCIALGSIMLFSPSSRYVVLGWLSLGAVGLCGMVLGRKGISRKTVRTFQIAAVLLLIGLYFYLRRP